LEIQFPHFAGLVISTLEAPVQTIAEVLTGGCVSKVEAILARVS
jgi:hypothetical protein